MPNLSLSSSSARRNRLILILAAVLVGLLTLGSAIAAEIIVTDKLGSKTAGKAAAGKDKPAIHPEADRILRESCAKLAAAKALSFKAEVWEDTVVAGHKVSTSKTVDIRLRRPDRAQAEVRSPSRSRGMWYDGSSLTMLDRAKNLYASVAAPGTIDKVVDEANDKYGFSFPLEDFLVGDPYASAKSAVKGGAYFGKVNLLGTPCQHLAFSTDALDLQLWVADDTKLPRKYVITYKNENTDPQLTALFDKWDLDSQLSDEAFVFSPPEGATKIKMSPREASDILQPTGRN